MISEDNPHRLRQMVQGHLFSNRHEKSQFLSLYTHLYNAYPGFSGLAAEFQAGMRGIMMAPLTTQEAVSYLRNWKSYEDSLLQFLGIHHSLLKDIWEMLSHTDDEGIVHIQNADERKIFKIDNLARKVSSDIKSFIALSQGLVDIHHEQGKLSRHLKPEPIRAFRSTEEALEKQIRELSHPFMHMKKDYHVEWHEIEASMPMPQQGSSNQNQNTDQGNPQPLPFPGLNQNSGFTTSR